MKYKIIITIQSLLIVFLLGYTFYQSDWYRDWVKVDYFGGAEMSLVLVQSNQPTTVSFLEYEYFVPYATGKMGDVDEDGWSHFEWDDREADASISIQFRSPRLYMIKMWLIDKLVEVKTEYYNENNVIEFKNFSGTWTEFSAKDEL